MYTEEIAVDCGKVILKEGHIFFEDQNGNQMDMKSAAKRFGWGLLGPAYDQLYRKNHYLQALGYGKSRG